MARKTHIENGSATCKGSKARGIGAARLAPLPDRAANRECCEFASTQRLGLAMGAPRIHGELKMLGFDISERTVLALDVQGSQESGAGQAVGGLPEQSSGRHRRHEFFCANARFRRVVLLLRNSSSSEAHSSLQRHSISDQRIGISAAAGGLPLRLRAKVPHPRS